MKQELKENTGLPSSLLWILAIIAGISVANLYYNQPLLNLISHDLKVSEFSANLIAMTTQIGYALGLLFIIPLGDLYKRKTIILINFSILVVSLLTIATAPNIYIILLASLLTGICSVMPQIFVPIAAQFSTPETKGKNVGMIISGLLTGILASRVVSGIAGEYMGWRFIFYVAAVLMVVCVIIIMRILPDIPSNFRGKYSGLDEITSLLGDGLSAAAHLVPPCRHSIRLFFGFMEFIGFQDGASPFLCRQQCNRLVGFMWHYGSFDGLFYRPVCAYPGGKTTELYRLQPLVYCMAFTLYRTKFVCRHYLRHLTDRYRYAMYPTQ